MALPAQGNTTRQCCRRLELRPLRGTYVRNATLRARWERDLLAGDAEQVIEARAGRQHRRAGRRPQDRFRSHRRRRRPRTQPRSPISGIAPDPDSRGQTRWGILVPASHDLFGAPGPWLHASLFRSISPFFHFLFLSVSILRAIHRVGPRGHALLLLHSGTTRTNGAQA